MKCEKCHGTLKKTMVNTVEGEGYTTLIRYTCSECDFNFMKVA